jgi:hypothetical protein
VNAVHAGGPTRVRANHVMRMLSIAHLRVGIVMHCAAAGGSHHIEPSLVRKNVQVCAAEQFAHPLIEDDGISAHNVLHERTLEIQLFTEQWRKAGLIRIFSSINLSRLWPRFETAALQSVCAPQDVADG